MGNKTYVEGEHRPRFTILSIEPSPCSEFHKGPMEDPEASTTWVLLESPDGDVVEYTLEELLDLETVYPLERDGCLSGDYAQFMAAQSGGKTAAREYAARSGENTQVGDGEDYRHRRHLLMAAREVARNGHR
jgi:hypothetical protein